MVTISGLAQPQLKSVSDYQDLSSWEEKAWMESIAVDVVLRRCFVAALEECQQLGINFVFEGGA